MNTTDLAGGQWTTGVLVGLPFAGLFTLILLGAVIWLLVLGIKATKKKRAGKSFVSYYDVKPRTWYLWSAGAMVVLLGFLVGMGAAYWPWKAEYHQYRNVQGTISTITSRFLGSNGSTDQKFVVVLTSGTQQYGINDTRAALLKPGDHVSMNCIRVYEYGSSDAGYDCKWA